MPHYNNISLNFKCFCRSTIHEVKPVRKLSAMQQIHRHLDVPKNSSVVIAPNKTDRPAGDRNQCKTPIKPINLDVANVQTLHNLDRSRITELTKTVTSRYRSIQTVIDSTGKPALAARWSPL